MRSARFTLLLSIFAVSALPLSGCKEEPPPPQPEPAASASSAAAMAKSRAATKSPVASVPKIDPKVLKEYRVDLCYAGSTTLRQARDAYLASLGGAEPSAKKVPNFGTASPAAAAGGAATPPPGAPGKPGAPAAPPKAGTSAAPATPPATNAGAGRAALPTEMRKPYDLAMRAPHERNARACTAASAMKEPAMEGVDGAVAEFGPYAVELAKTIVQASTYYQREEFKSDNFAKGKELHKKLVADFEKFDDMSAKLGAAVDAWRKAHPIDTNNMEEGQKLTMAALEDARAAFVLLLPKEVDVDAYKAAIAKLEKSAEALKTLGTAQPNDSWAKIMGASFDAFIKAAKATGDKLTDKGPDPDTFLTTITSFTSLIESKHRAYTRAMVAKQRAGEASPGTAPAASGHPVAAPGEERETE
jgi:hypothetical protein